MPMFGALKSQLLDVLQKCLTPQKKVNARVVLGWWNLGPKGATSKSTSICSNGGVYALDCAYIKDIRAYGDEATQTKNV